MKKIFFAFAVMAVLFGCTKGSNASSDPTVSKLEVVMNIEKISEDILNYFDIEFNYEDFTGKSSSKPVTGPSKFSFSVDNPSLGEESSMPYTVELKITQKSTTQKESGSYDASISWQMDENGYDQNGNLITDSGCVQMKSPDSVYANDKFENFVKSVDRSELTSITYRTFFCKTLSGEWHIGVEGKQN